jgi:hypothetical protein
MNSTIEGIDARAYLIGWLKGLSGMYIADIKAMPADQWNKSQGGCTRPASALTADALSLMLWTVDALSGKVGGHYDEATMKQLQDECETPEAAIAKMAEATDNLASAIARASDETLNTPITAPWGMPAPLFTIAQAAVSHIWYHDGQLNYVQCLHGDGQVHWMGE